MKRNRPVSLFLVGLFLWVNGCTSYQHVGLVEVTDHGKVRVTLNDGSRFVVAHPQVEADSLFGFEAGSWNARSKVYVDTVRVALEQIETLEASQANVGKTVGLVVSIVAGVVLLGTLIWAASDPCIVYCD